jgi:hypothetical protein
MARHHLQIELRHDLAWLEPLTARAGEYKTELTAGEETKRAATAKLMALAGLAHDLENEVRGRADLERQLASTTLQLDDAKKALASPDCLTMEDGALLRLKLTADHLPSRIAELQTGIATATARISALLDQTGIDRAKFMAGMKAS